MQKQLRLQWGAVALKFLNDSNFIENLKQEKQLCESYKVDTLVSITVPVDLMLLAETDSELANYIILDPREGAMLFQEFIHQMLIIHRMIPDTTEVTQIAIALRITAAALPDFCAFGLKQLSYKGLTRLCGVVSGVTAAVKYTKSTRYICPNEECEGHYGNKYVRVHIPGASEKEMVDHGFHCCACGAALKEIQSERTLSGNSLPLQTYLAESLPRKKLMAEIVPLNLLKGNTNYLQTGCRQQAISIIIRDDLCSEITLGQYCELVGTQKAVYKDENITYMFEVNNFIRQKDSACLIGTLPASVQRLFAKWQSSPCIFPQAMATKLGVHVCPPGLCLKLKLMLLVSLVLTPELPPLHVLCVYRESDIVQRLMVYCCRLAARATCHSSLNTLGAKISSNRYQWSPYFVQAGSLVLAREGVCRICGDIRALKRADKQELQTAMSENRVQVALESRHTGSLPCVLQIPLACQVWAYTARSDLVPNSSSFLGAYATPDIPTSLSEAFSVISIGESVGWDSSNKVDCELADHLIAASMNIENRVRESVRKSSIDSTGLSTVYESANISTDDFAQYVHVARGQKSTLTVEAERLLMMYLNAVRRTRSSSAPVTGTCVPSNAWQTLRAMSHGWCRLNLRQEVLEVDALMSVMLYEEMLASRNGISPLNVIPFPHLSANLAKDYLCEQESTLRRFHARLLNFSANFTRMAVSNEE